MRSIGLFCKMVADACLEGKASFLEGQEVIPPKESDTTAKPEDKGKENAA